MNSWEDLSAKERQEALRPFIVRQKICPFTAEELIRWAILTTLMAFGGNRTHTAAQLGLSIRTIRNHIRRYRDQGFYVPVSCERSDLASNVAQRDNAIGA